MIAAIIVVVSGIVAITTLIIGAVTGIGALAVVAMVSALVSLGVAASQANSDPSDFQG